VLAYFGYPRAGEHDAEDTVGGADRDRHRAGGGRRSDWPGFGAGAGGSRQTPNSRRGSRRWPSLGQW
jgi:hypothetical protein